MTVVRVTVVAAFGFGAAVLAERTVCVRVVLAVVIAAGAAVSAVVVAVLVSVVAGVASVTGSGAVWVTGAGSVGWAS